MRTPQICWNIFGGGGGGGAAAAAATPTPVTSLATVQSPKYGLSTEYGADNVTRVPTINSPNELEAARLRQAQIFKRSGRASTQLTSIPGTATYANSFLGGYSATGAT